MPLSELHDKVVSTAKNFCKGCDNLGESMQYPAAPEELMGAACDVMAMETMVASHERGECSLAMIDGKPGTMTLQGFVPETSVEVSTIENV